MDKMKKQILYIALGLLALIAIITTVLAIGGVVTLPVIGQPAIEQPAVSDSQPHGPTAAEGEALSDRVLRREMRRIDKGRASAYALFSSTHWGDKANYDLCINTSHVIIKEMVPSLAAYAERWFQKEV